MSQVSTKIAAQRPGYSGFRFGPAGLRLEANAHPCLHRMNPPPTPLSLMAVLSASMSLAPLAFASDLTAPDTHHQVTCPAPADAPCIMKRPFHAMDYTLLTKDVTITEGNGVWIVDLTKKTSKKQTIRVVDFYGELHTIDITLEAAAKPETAAKPARTNTKTAAPADKKSPPTLDANGKPISLEKYMGK